MTSSSCYSMKSITTPKIIPMEILTTITSIPTSIYGSSSISFDEDTQAKTTVDIE